MWMTVLNSTLGATDEGWRDSGPNTPTPKAMLANVLPLPPERCCTTDLVATRLPLDLRINHFLKTG